MRWIHCRGESTRGRFRAGGSPPGHPASIPWCNPNINKPKWFFFLKKKETKPNLVCGDRFLPLLFPVPQSSSSAAESFGGCREREERGRSVPPAQDHRQGRTGGTNRCSTSSLPLSCFFWGDLSPFRPTPTHPRGPCGAAGVGKLPELLPLFLLLRVFGGEKGILDECFVPAADAVALPVRFGRGSPTAAAPGPWGWR